MTRESSPWWHAETFAGTSLPPPSQATEAMGALAAEAAKVVAALQERWGDDVHLSSLATGAPECTVCPVCRAIAAVRGATPEQVDQVTTAAIALVESLRRMLADVGSRYAATGSSAAEPDDDDGFSVGEQATGGDGAGRGAAQQDAAGEAGQVPGDARPPSRLQRITLDD